MVVLRKLIVKQQSSVVPARNFELRWRVGFLFKIYKISLDFSEVECYYSKVILKKRGNGV